MLAKIASAATGGRAETGGSPRARLSIGHGLWLNGGMSGRNLGSQRRIREAQDVARAHPRNATGRSRRCVCAIGADEIVQVVDGAATLHVMTEEGQQSHALKAGMVVIVPQAVWHRFEAPEGVSLMTTTPQPTQHLTFAIDDPRTLG
jgi:hypothetical protein